MKERLGGLSSLITVAVRLHPGLNLGRQQQYTDTVRALVQNMCSRVLNTKARQQLWVAALRGVKPLKSLVKSDTDNRNEKNK